MRHLAAACSTEKCARGPVSRVLYDLPKQIVATIPLGDGSRRRSSNQPGRRAGTAHLPPLFGLAPGGVCHAAAVTGGAVGSYPTLSTWPDRSPVDCFLWHFPWGRPRRPLTGTVVPWSPDFPRPRLREAAAARPSGGGGYSEAKPNA